MPYCEPCARHWTPSSMGADGSCPTCGAVLARPPLVRAAAEVAERRTTGAPADGVTPTEEPVPKAPWHFKVLLVALAVYLSFRAWQGVGWVAQHL